ncbi:MAG: DUF3499 family protein [Microthrixaceae bacterium]
MSRSCARPGCARGAVATLSYAYADSTVWLEDLAVEGHPMTHDLCDLHSANVRVPRGWTLEDARTPPEAAVPPALDGGLRLVGA